MKDHPSNRWKNSPEDFEEINSSLDEYFQNLMGEAETHLSRVFCKLVRTEVRDTNVDTFKLPSSYTKRRMFEKC